MKTCDPHPATVAARTAIRWGACRCRSHRALVATLLVTVALGACAKRNAPHSSTEPGEAARLDVQESELSDPERYRAFLRFYAPLILKQAHEEPGLAGRDWITNFFFDDDRLSNNRLRWTRGLRDFMEGATNVEWQIRPTLYTHAIEFFERGERSVVLVYHVYHAMQASGIHDWERIELRIDGANRRPGQGERIRFAVITRHSAHRARGPEELHWYETEYGRHLLLWQAPWSNSWDGAFLAALPRAPFSWGGFEATPRKAELRFVDEEWDQIAASLASEEPALVAIGGTLRPYPVHYVFVPDSDARSVAALGAQRISPANPRPQSAGKRQTETSSGVEVRRVCYELQDTADIFPTHWDRSQDGVENLDWTAPRVPILMDREIRDEDGRTVIPVGHHHFLAASIDDAGGTRRFGYPAKHWFWGAYHFGRAGNFRADALADGAPRRTRALANNCRDCLGAYWYQHDYFAHTGEVAPRGRDEERGRWLPRGWHRAERGGFDGRWVQLFADPPSQRCPGADAVE